jgi:hypothetical protein
VLKQALLIHVDIDPAEEEKERLVYLAMLVESKVSSSTHSSDGSESPEVSKNVLVVDALDCEAKAAYIEYRDFNQNRRCHDAFVKEKSSKDKGKAVKGDDPTPLPQQILHKVAHVAELPSSQDDKVLTIYEACKARQLPDGLGSLGARALHVKVRVGSLANEEVKARLDSRADITLMSEEFWMALGLPKPWEGIHMSLYHLTGQAKVLGYVKCSIYMVNTKGEVIHFDLEAYVVRNMKVFLLLGEDFQSACELRIKRSTTGHCEVQVGQSWHVIAASSAHSVDLGFEIRQASMAKSMKRLLPRVWRKTYQRSKAHKRREEKLEAPPVLAARDTLIAAGTVHNVPITGPFEGKKEWLVEKVVITTEDESVMAAPSTFINSESPFLPITNPSTRPWYICAGDVVGRLQDPADYVDTPKNEEEREKFAASAEALVHVIQEMRCAQDPENVPKGKQGAEDKRDEDEDWGPKTTALPGDFVGLHEGEDIAQMVNLGPVISTGFVHP